MLMLWVVFSVVGGQDSRLPPRRTHSDLLLCFWRALVGFTCFWNAVVCATSSHMGVALIAGRSNGPIPSLSFLTCGASVLRFLGVAPAAAALALVLPLGHGAFVVVVV